MSGNGEMLNETPSESEKMDISEMSDHPSAESDQSRGDVVDDTVERQQLDNAPAMAANTRDTVTTPGRGRLDSALSLDGLDLELPTLDAYQEEYVDFPSSPKHLKECFEANGVALPLERDSGTAGRSEEEDDEDTSIYQAVLSPDCRDVRLRKERLRNDFETTDDLVEAILAEDDDDLDNGDEAPLSEGSGTGLGAERVSRKLLVPNLNELSLADMYNSSGSGPILTLENSEVSPEVIGDPQLNSTPEGSGDGFIVESHNSSLAQRQYGRHVIKGLFVESPHKMLPLKRVSAPQQELLDSPKEEDEFVDAESLFHQPTKLGNGSDEKENDHKNAVCSEIHGQDTPVPSPRTKPVPMIRTVLTDDVERDSNQERGPALILDPSKLDLKLARRTPQISDDSSVEKLKGWLQELLYISD